MLRGRPLTGHRRVAWECGFGWALAQATTDPSVPPDRDIVSLGLTVAQARSALGLDPETWWAYWAAGWVAGLDARGQLAGGDGA